MEAYGRDSRIRTCDPLIPNQALYQAELYPDNGGEYGIRTHLISSLQVRGPPQAVPFPIANRRSD